MPETKESHMKRRAIDEAVKRAKAGVHRELKANAERQKKRFAARGKNAFAAMQKHLVPVLWIIDQLALELKKNGKDPVMVLSDISWERFTEARPGHTMISKDDFRRACDTLMQAFQAPERFSTLISQNGDHTTGLY